VAQRAAGVDRDVGGAGADVDHAYAEFALVLGQHGARRSDRRRQQLVHLQAAAVDALGDVLRPRWPRR
jgi:hypothetical protein